MPTYHLRLFGGPHLRGPTGVLTGRVSQRRPVALLAVLAVAGEQGVTRDRATGLLWGESDDKHALRYLSDTLYVIHSNLGTEAVVATGVGLRLGSGVVAADVGAFASALAQGDDAAAVAAYGGPLLEGFHLPDAPAFEEWLDAERRRFATRVADALESLAVAAQRAGDLGAAIGFWRRLASEDPYNSRVAVELARALALAGDPGNALQTLRDHAEELRTGLGAEPDAEVLQLTEELRAGSGRPAGPRPAAGVISPDTSHVDAEAGAGGPAVGTGPTVAPPVEEAPRTPLVPVARSLAARPAWAALALVVLLAAGWGAVRLLRAHFGPPIHSIAVLPLKNLTGDSAIGPLVDGVTEELTARLGRVAGLQVTSRTSAERYRDSKLGSTRIAAELGVEGLLEGAAVRWGNRVRVTVQVIDARRDRHLGAETLDRPWGALSDVPADLAEVVLEKLRIRPTAEEWRRVSKPSSRNPAVAVLLAQRRWREALALDSNDARAWAARSLAMADSTWWWPQPASWRPAPYIRAARAAADRAMLLDSTESDAQVALGVAAQLVYDYAMAERALRRAIALEPSNALAHANLADLLMVLGRLDESLAEARLAKRFDPFSKAVRRELLWALTVANRWSEYDSEAREWLQLWPDTASRYDLYGNSLMFARLCAGRPLETLRILDSVLAITGDTAEARYDQMRAIALARLARKDEAIRIVHRAERVTDVYMRRFWMAWAYAAVGDMDRAANAFRDAAAIGELGLLATVRSCVADPLRADSRWPELLRLINLSK